MIHNFLMFTTIVENVYDGQGDFDRALSKNYTNRDRTQTRSGGSRDNNRGITYSKKDEVNLALEDFKQFDGLFKSDGAIAFFNCGATYRNKGEYDGM